MYLVVTAAAREPSWHEAPARGTMTIGSAREGDVQLFGHNIAARHVRLVFGARVRIEVRKPYGVRLDGRIPREDDVLARGSVLEIGSWRVALGEEPPSGIEPVDEAFLAANDDDSRLVYADSLEERGRFVAAELVRGVAPSEVPALAARTSPAWRRRVLPIAIEGCSRPPCPRVWSAREPCSGCGKRVEIFGNIGAAREHALRGGPVAIDPAVRRWPNDLRQPVVKRPAIIMGQPSHGK